MKKTLILFKNKYVLTLTLCLIYNLFLDDIDLFTIINQNRKLSKMRVNQTEVRLKLLETKTTLAQLKNSYALEKFAREEKLFKKDNEDVFVITYE